MKAIRAVCVLALGSLVACSGKTRAFAEAEPEGTAGAPPEMAAPPAEVPSTPPVNSTTPDEAPPPVGALDTPRADNLGGIRVVGTQTTLGAGLRGAASHAFRTSIALWSPAAASLVMVVGASSLCRHPARHARLTQTVRATGAARGTATATGTPWVT